MADPDAGKCARVWLPRARLKRRADMMESGHRDPEMVGYAWAAWWALRGDEPLERVRECAVDLERQLGQLGVKLHKRLDSNGASVVAAAHLFMIALAELLDEKGTSEFKAKIERRKRGKPINRHERALRGRKAAGIVMELLSEGWKQEAALQQATQQTGLSRAEIMTWLRSSRLILAGHVPSDLPRSVERMLEPWTAEHPNSENNQD